MNKAQIIGERSIYINVYNNGNLGLPMIANIPIANESKVMEIYGDNPNFTIEHSGCKYIMNWVIN